MAITTRQELIDYCLRSLGSPVIEINVETTQLSDRIDEAIQYYQEYHSDAIVPVFIQYQITAQDVTNQYITIPDSLTSVERILPLGSGSFGGGIFDARYQMSFNDMYLLRGGLVGNLSYYTQTMSHMNLVNSLFNPQQPTRYARHMDRLYIDGDWEADIIEGSYIVIEGNQIIDPVTYTQVYNDSYLKRYATQLIKRQWGSNLLKFEGMQLPGGVQFSGRQIFEDANAEIERLQEEIRLVWEKPVDFYCG